MNILLYDPLFSDIGHFLRYNKYLTELLSNMDEVTTITIIAENKKLLSLAEVSAKVKVLYVDTEIKSLQIKSMQAKGWQKMKLFFKAYSNYSKIIKKINISDADLVLFASQGQLAFWLNMRKLRLKYIVSAISIKWIYKEKGIRNFLYTQYRYFLKRSELNLFTEIFYKEISEKEGVFKGLVMPDRYLSPINFFNESAIFKDKIKFLTVGTISKSKNPLSFVKEWVRLKPEILKYIEYEIAGKAMDISGIELVKEIENCKNILFTDAYIADDAYEKLMKEADFMVIPYSGEYTKYVTSGVMWDCFERGKPIVCPDIEPFKYYINQFKIGYLYKEGELEKTIALLIAEKTIFLKDLKLKYQKMHELYSKEKLLFLFKKHLNSL